MSTIRLIQSKSNSVGSGSYLRDYDLSLKAKGLLAQMIVYPLRSDFSLDAITFFNRDGEQSIRAAVRELEQNGYLYRYQGRDAMGHLLPVEYIIFEDPTEGIEMHELNHLNEHETPDGPVSEDIPGDYAEEAYDQLVEYLDLLRKLNISVSEMAQVIHKLIPEFSSD